jgi:DNA/RNA endonuclease YhcR with UshA esterase domain
LVTIGDKNEIELLTLLIPGAERQNFTKTPETAYLNEYVQVTGRVLLYKGKMQITLYSEKQISIARDAMLNTPIRDRLQNF